MDAARCALPRIGSSEPISMPDDVVGDLGRGAFHVVAGHRLAHLANHRRIRVLGHLVLL